MNFCHTHTRTYVLAVVVLCLLAMLGGCGANAFESIGGLLESSASQDSDAAASAVKKPPAGTGVNDAELKNKTYSAQTTSAQAATTCQQKKQQQKFTAEASGTYTQTTTALPEVRMLLLVETEESIKNDVLKVASGLVSFVQRVDELSNIQAHLLVDKSALLRYIGQSSGGAFPALSEQFFEELPSSIEHFDAEINSRNSLNKTYEHLQVHPDFWLGNSPKIIKALVVISDGYVEDSVYVIENTKHQTDKKSWSTPGFVSFITNTNRAKNFHLYGFLDLDYNSYFFNKNWKNRSNTPIAHRHPKVKFDVVPYHYYVNTLGGKLFHVLNAGSDLVTQKKSPIDWNTAFTLLYDSIHVEIKKIAPNVVQTQCAITKVQSVHINQNRLDPNQFTIEAAERLVKITAPLAQDDIIKIDYETSVQNEPVPSSQGSG